ncbi:hypothetical protein [Tuberibacillus sp. Marseille-P3662]|uniref:hypothetical protein n=1 Tax=Tuberibacillus sp. Marseille-P3662 TaxID=1965358 RepID=UPI000A1CD830|nr:hypothetical protein [Tuberibacillus sp. Marseille-P3662]
MKPLIRGVSVHASSSGLRYLIHYDNHTKAVTSAEYQVALFCLKEWEQTLYEEPGIDSLSEHGDDQGLS